MGFRAGIPQQQAGAMHDLKEAATTCWTKCKWKRKRGNQRFSEPLQARAGKRRSAYGQATDPSPGYLGLAKLL